MAVNPAVQAYADAARAYQDATNTSIDGIVGDLKAQDDLIAQLQARPEGWGPEDQALLDQIQAGNKALADRAKALDDLKPPTVPQVPVAQ